MTNDDYSTMIPNAKHATKLSITPSTCLPNNPTVDQPNQSTKHPKSLPNPTPSTSKMTAKFGLDQTFLARFEESKDIRWAISNVRARRLSNQGMVCN
jgi:hypothetical protein